MTSRVKQGFTLASAALVWLVLADLITAALLVPGSGFTKDFARSSDLDYTVHPGRSFAPLTDRLTGAALRGPAAAESAFISPFGPMVAGSHLRFPGTIGPSRRELSWEGRFERTASGSGPDACDAPNSASPCDRYFVTVDADSTYWAGRTGGALISIAFERNQLPGTLLYNDFDLYVYRGGERIAGSVTRGVVIEEIFIPLAAGSYEIRIVPERASGGGYRGVARFLSREESPPVNQAYYGVPIRGKLPSHEPQSSSIVYSGEPLALRDVDIGNVNAPSIEVAPDGTAYFVHEVRDGDITPLPGESRNHLRRSTDGGITWQYLAPTFVGRRGPTLAADPELFVDPSTGRLFWLDGAFYFSDWVWLSDDRGTSFEFGGVPPSVRPWLVTGATPRALRLTPAGSDLGIVYHCGNDWDYSRLICQRSLDGGRTFVSTGAPPFTGWNLEKAAECRVYAGDGKTDAAGRLFIPRHNCDRWDPRDDLRYFESVAGLEYDTSWGQNEIPMLAISADAGSTWEHVVVNDDVRAVHNSLPQVAVDAVGSLYYVWEDVRHHLPYMTTSTDHGKTWSPPVMIAPPGVREASFSNVVAGDAGRVAVSFVGTRTADPKDLTRPWNLYVAVTENALAEQPFFVSTTVNDASDPVHRGDCELACSWSSLFVDIELSPADGGIWIGAVDTCTNVKRCRTHPGVGHTMAHGPGVSADQRGIAVRQLSGPWLRERRVRASTEPDG